MLRLTTNNYYSPAANREYMSVSQFKAFMKCPAAAMAELSGEYSSERGRALVLGSYVDAMLTGSAREQEQFIEENRSELFKKNGDPYADIEQADQAIARIREQPLMMKYLGGEHQVVMTGGVAQNSGIVNALQKQLGCKIHTSPLTQYNGALGAALFAYQVAARKVK